MGLKDIFKNIKRRNKSNSVRICPLCKQSTLYHISGGNWTTTEYFKCSECDYEGAFYLEVDPNENASSFADLEKLKKEFPEDLDPSTDIEFSQKVIQDILEKKAPKKEKEDR